MGEASAAEPEQRGERAGEPVIATRAHTECCRGGQFAVGPDGPCFRAPACSSAPRPRLLAPRPPVADLVREPAYWDELRKNLGPRALYAVVFGPAARVRFGTKDGTA